MLFGEFLWPSAEVIETYKHYWNIPAVSTVYHSSSWICFTWPLRKQVAYKQATRAPTALSSFRGTRHEDKVPFPSALLPGWDSNRGPFGIWKSVVKFIHLAMTAPHHTSQHAFII